MIISGVLFLQLQGFLEHLIVILIDSLQKLNPFSFIGVVNTAVHDCYRLVCEAVMGGSVPLFPES